MTPSSNSSNRAVSEPLPNGWEFVLYPFHFIPRVLARTLAFLAAVAALFAASVGLLLLLLFAADFVSDDLLPYLLKLGSGPLFGSVVALGLVSALLKIANRSALGALREIGQEFQEMGPDWIPPRNLKQSFIDTWDDCLARIFPTAGNLCSLSFKFYFALVLLALLAFCLYAQAVADRDSKKHVQHVLESVTELQARPAVVVVAGGGGAGDGLPAFATPFYSGGVYSIAHVKQGSLKEGKGICLDDHVSLLWLKTFKTALEECAKAIPACRPKVTVRGFASNAPVGLPEALANTSGLSQADLNCEVANRRAEEVVNFLVDDDYKCHASVHELERYGPRDPCKRNEKSYEFGKKEGLAFDVSYTPWRPPEEMVKEKPANDGKEGERRYKVEFFNRAVQLTLSNYGCDRQQCEPSQEEDTGEDGATSSGGDAEDDADDSGNGRPGERLEAE